MERGTALVTGVGPGLGAAICRRLVNAGFRVAAVARSSSSGDELAGELSAGQFRFYQADVAAATSLDAAVERARAELGPFSVLVHNASSIHIAPFADTPNEQFERLWQVTCLGGVNSVRAVLPDLTKRGDGAMIFTGATASLRGGAQFAAFASAKFALRGLVQALAREHGPNGIHVAHVIIDGLIWAQQARDRFNANKADCLRPEAIADQYVQLIEQDRSAWTHELDLRPYKETF